jgi:hypothetical protein
MDENDFDDLDARSDDFNRRADEARGRDGVVGGLVVDAERNRKILNMLAVVVGLVVALLLILVAVAATVWHNTGVIADQAQSACVQTAKNSMVINDFLTLLAINADTSEIFSDEEAAARIIGYKKLLIDIPDCNVNN